MNEWMNEWISNEMVERNEMEESEYLILEWMKKNEWKIIGSKSVEKMKEWRK
jgi:hypothetical protein